MSSGLGDEYDIGPIDPGDTVRQDPEVIALRMLELGAAPLAIARVAQLDDAAITIEPRGEAFAASASLPGDKLATVRAALEAAAGAAIGSGRDSDGVQWCAFRAAFALLLIVQEAKGVHLWLEPYGQSKPMPAFEPDIASWLAERRATTSRVVTPRRVPEGAAQPVLYKAGRDGRLADSDHVRTLARWFVELGAAPITRAALATFATKHDLHEKSAYGLARIAIPDTHTEMQYEFTDDNVHDVFAWLGMLGKPGATYDKLFETLAAEVDAELGEPARTGRDRSGHRYQWRVYRTKTAIAILAQHDNWHYQHGEAIALWLFPWTETALPDLGDPAVDWITREARRRREGDGVRH